MAARRITIVTEATIHDVVAAIRARQRFVVTSHARPDGDAIGSQVAMGLALKALGKDVRLVDADPPPPPMRELPGVELIEVTPRIDDPGDAVITMECGDLARPGVEGLAAGYVINIDHHPGNTGFGALNWIDLSAAACGEMVFNLIVALGAPLSPEIATHIYLTILTDTGQFHYSHVTPRTFEICRLCVEAGADPTGLSRTIYDNNSLGRVRLFGAVLDRMELDATGRVATLVIDRALAARCGGSYDDTEGLINFPLTVKDIQAVIFFKETATDDWRISMRSKGPVNVNAVAKEFGGGGHVNASGCGASGRLDDLKRVFEAKVAAAIAAITHPEQPPAAAAR
jgi:bifunctional oligoribonuclease and PAP phosphatase NrnA